MWQFDRITNCFVLGALPLNGAKITACYERLSQEDALDGDSGSILNQRDFLLKYCTDHRFPHPRFFSDDGYTGTNFDRPGFHEMMELVSLGHVGTIIVKDHSRLGRNRLAVGALMERFTEDYNVRYIAVTDNIDSDRGLDDMVAVRELFNEFYPRDTSKKVRAVFANKGNNGERLCTNVPYGYIGDKHSWEIDPETAPVVRQIYALCIDGKGPMQIAKHLSAQKILTPNALLFKRGERISGPADPYYWSMETISSILSRKEYTGCTVNFKTTKKSYKSKKIVRNAPEHWREFADTHPAIIDLETWERVQELRKNKRLLTKAERQGLFSGLLLCPDCGNKLHFSTCKNFDRSQDHYRCSRYKSNTGTCTAHYIRESVLYDLVLEHLRQTIYCVRTYDGVFLEAMMDKDAEEQIKALTHKRNELEQAERRFLELDTLFQRVYEDNISGKLSDERYNKLSAIYETEQQELSEKIKVLHAELNAAEEHSSNVSQFIALVKQYTRVEELTPTILNQFINHILVYAPDKSTGKRIQKIEIHYNFIGKFPICLTKNKTA